MSKPFAPPAVSDRAPQTRGGDAASGTPSVGSREASWGAATRISTQVPRRRLGFAPSAALGMRAPVSPTRNLRAAGSWGPGRSAGHRHQVAGAARTKGHLRLGVQIPGDSEHAGVRTHTGGESQAPRAWQSLCHNLALNQVE